MYQICTKYNLTWIGHHIVQCDYQYHYTTLLLDALSPDYTSYVSYKEMSMHIKYANERYKVGSLAYVFAENGK